MTSYVALLRAVNVGGHASLGMADLRHSLEGLGLANVRTYLQSGNALFETDGGWLGDSGTVAAASTIAPEVALAEALAVRIERDAGPRVGVRVLDAGEMARVIAANPFAAEAAVDERWLQATFLLPAAAENDFGPADEAAYAAVYRAAFDRLTLPAQDGERAALVGPPSLATPVVFLRLPHGYGRTKLNNAYFERALGAAATTRSWRTVRALADLVTGGG